MYRLYKFTFKLKLFWKIVNKSKSTFIPTSNLSFSLLLSPLLHSPLLLYLLSFLPSLSPPSSLSFLTAYSSLTPASLSSPSLSSRSLSPLLLTFSLSSPSHLLSPSHLPSHLSPPSSLSFLTVYSSPTPASFSSTS